MAFQIDPNIPLQANKVQFDPAAILMQAQQNGLALEKHRFEMQKLREDYDLAKEQRKQQKAMQMGIASDLAGIQSGSPAQYAPTRFEQTPQRGQMPQGMTGVMMREQGQQMPQPQAFGEEILNGDFRLGGGEVTQEAVAGRQPTYPEMLAIGLKQAMLTKNQDEIFKYAKAIQETEKQAVKFGMNPTKGINPQTMQPDYFVVNELGQKQFLGVNPYESPKDIKAPVTYSVKNDRVETTYGLDAKGNPVVLGRSNLDAPQSVKASRDPVEKALEITEGKEQIKARYAQQKEVAKNYSDADSVIPLLNVYIDQLKKTPKTAFGRGTENILGGIGVGNTEQQDAMAASEQTAKTLINYAQKQPGPSTDADVKNYLEQVGVASNPMISRSGRLAAAESAKAYALSIKAKYGKYSSDILSGKVVPDELKQEQPVDKKALYNDFLKGRAMLRGNPAALKQYDDAARADGIIK
jgi:hypothetical protein